MSRTRTTTGDRLERATVAYHDFLDHQHHINLFKYEPRRRGRGGAGDTIFQTTITALDNVIAPFQ